MPSVKSVPKRSEVPPSDCWDLSSLFADDSAWEKAFTKWEKRVKGYVRFQGTLGESAEKLAACLKFDLEVDRQGERVGAYAMLRSSEDKTNSLCQRMEGRFMNAASRASESFTSAIF